MDPIVTLSQHSIVTLEHLATAAFAISGVIGALRKRMDIVGICVCGFLAAFGGGTLRDILLDRRPFFWVEHQTRSTRRTRPFHRLRDLHQSRAS